jgi:hypothetical protein
MRRVLYEPQLHIRIPEGCIKRYLGWLGVPGMMNASFVV